MSDEVAFNKALEIIRQMSEGKRLILPDRNITIAMGEDYRIGVVMANLTTGGESIGGMVEFTVRDIMQYVKKYNLVPI